MKRARVKWVVMVAAAIGSAAPALASEAAAPTHIAVFDSVAGQVVSALLPPGAIPPGRSLEIATPLAGDTLSLLEHRILTYLKRAGISVRVAPPVTAQAPSRAFDPVTGEPTPPSDPATSGASLRLETRVESKTVSYLRRIGKFPFGTRGYERLVSLQAQSRLLDAATGEILWARSGSGRVSDMVRAGDVEAVASSGGGLFQPALPPRSGLRFLEPVIVAGVVVGLVVLFYSNRT